MRKDIRRFQKHIRLFQLVPRNKAWQEVKAERKCVGQEAEACQFQKALIKTVLIGLEYIPLTTDEIVIIIFEWLVVNSIPPAIADTMVGGL